jgi:hypothetical protein
MGLQHGVSRLLGLAFIPASFLLSTTVSELYSYTRSHLLHIAVAWGFIAILLLVRTGHRKISFNRSWRAGAVFAMSQICTRIAADRDSVRWTYSIIPLAIYVALRTGCGLNVSSYSVVASEKTPAEDSFQKTIRFAFAIPASFGLLAHGYCSPSATLLGLSGAILSAVAVVWLEQSLEDSYREDEIAGRSSERDVKSRRCCWIWSCSPLHVQVAIRDAAGVIALVCLIASFWVERPYLSPMSVIPSAEDIQNISAMGWKQLLFLSELEKLIKGIAAELLCAVFLLAMVCPTFVPFLTIVFVPNSVTAIHLHHRDC